MRILELDQTVPQRLWNVLPAELAEPMRQDRLVNFLRRLTWLACM